MDRQIDRQTAQQTDILTDQQIFTENDKSRQKVLDIDRQKQISYKSKIHEFRQTDRQIDRDR